MNEIELLKEKIEDRFPAVEIDLRGPRHDDSSNWLLELELEGNHLVVEWQEIEGWFGVSDCSSHAETVAFGGTKPDKTCDDMWEAFEIVIKKLGAESEEEER